MRLEVKLIEIDPKTGKLKLSRKVLLPRPPREEGDRKTGRSQELEQVMSDRK